MRNKIMKKKILAIILCFAMIITANQWGINHFTAAKASDTIADGIYRAMLTCTKSNKFTESDWNARFSQMYEAHIENGYLYITAGLERIVEERMNADAENPTEVCSYVESRAIKLSDAVEIYTWYSGSDGDEYSYDLEEDEVNYFFKEGSEYWQEYKNDNLSEIGVAFTVENGEIVSLNCWNVPTDYDGDDYEEDQDCIERMITFNTNYPEDYSSIKEVFEPVTVVQDEAIPEGTMPELSSTLKYEFAGWKYNDEFVEDEHTYTYDKNIEVKAEWIKKEEGTITISAGKVPPAPGVTLLNPDELIKKGVKLTSDWYKNNDFNKYYLQEISKKVKHKEAFEYFYKVLNAYYSYRDNIGHLFLEFTPTQGVPVYQLLHESPNDFQELVGAAYAFVYDNPALILNNPIFRYWSTSNGYAVDMYFNSGYDENITKKTNSLLYQNSTAYQKIIKSTGIASGDSEPVKVRKIADTLCEYLEYSTDKEVIDNEDYYDNRYRDAAYGIFNNKNNPKHMVVCVGYSKAFMQLCNYYKIPCVRAVGANHEWDYVKIGGKWYGVDVTWYDTLIPDDYILMGSVKDFDKEHPISDPEISKMIHANPGTKTLRGYERVTKSGVTYELFDTTAEVISVEKTKRSITIPDTVTVQGKKYKVTLIRGNAFKSSKVTTVTVGANVKTIKGNAFKGCKSLKKVVVKSTKLKSFPKSAFSGANPKVQIKVPASILSKCKKWLKGFNVVK